MVEEISILMRQPEYLHVLLHGFPVYGTILGAICLLFALLFRSRPAQVAALSVLLIGGAMALPVEHFGEEAEDRVETMTDAPGREWLESHKDRAEKVVPAYVTLAVCALAAMLIPGRFPRTRFGVTALTLVVALGCAAGGAWVSRAGGQIRHKEFRTGAGPDQPVALQRREHHGKRERH